MRAILQGPTSCVEPTPPHGRAFLWRGDSGNIWMHTPDGRDISMSSAHGYAVGQAPHARQCLCDAWARRLVSGAMVMLIQE